MELDLMQRQELVDSLLACATMSERDGRDVIVEELPAQIKQALVRDADDEKDIENIVKACEPYSDGLSTLLGLIRPYEVGSPEMDKIDEVWKDIKQELLEWEEDEEEESVDHWDQILSAVKYWFFAAVIYYLSIFLVINLNLVFLGAVWIGVLAILPLFILVFGILVALELSEEKPKKGHHKDTDEEEIDSELEEEEEIEEQEE